MAEENKPKTDYSSNSSKSKKVDGSPEDRPEIQKITSGKKQKPSISSKFRQNFTGDDAGSVGQYLLFDVIIPRTKELIFDLLTQGAQRTLWGDRPVSSKGSVLTGAGRTNYSGISTRPSPRDSSREISRVSRSTHNLDEILIENRGEAELVLDTLRETIDRYESVTLAELYSSVGISQEHTDNKFGWTDLSDGYVKPVRGGYLLVLPRAEVL